MCRKRGYRPPGPQPLGEGALRGQLDLQFTTQVLPGELLVLAHVRTHRAAYPVGGQQDAEAGIVDAAVVTHRLEVATTQREQGVNELDGNAAEAESTDREG